MLPEGWKLSCLGDACSGALQTGPFGSQLHAHEYTEHGISVLMPKDLINYRANVETAAKISIEKSEELKRHHLKFGDILFSRRGDVARLALIDDNSKDSLCGTGCLRARPSTKNFAGFLFFFLQLPTIKSWLEHNAVGQTMPNMNTEILYELPLILPPLPEQKKIAAILSTWDRAIEGTEKLLANSQQQKKALMQQLLTGKKRLPGFTGEWRNTKVGNYISERKKRNKNSISQLVLSITNRHGFENPEEYFSKRVASSDISNYKIVKTGDFGYNPSRINVGSFARLKKHTTAVVSPIYVVFHTSEKNLDGTYFDFWMHSHSAQQQVLNSTQGSVRNSVNFDSLCQFKIKLPPLPEQQAIAAVLSTADEEITAIESDLSRLRQEKKALMQQLLTGKRRVKVD